MLFKSSKPSSNGDAAAIRIDIPTPESHDDDRDQRKFDSRKQQETPGFTASSLARRRGIQVSFPASNLAMALGTTAGRSVHFGVQKIIAECGRLPGPASYLIIDAAEPPEEADLEHFVSIGRTGDGVGTLPENGRQAFIEDSDRISDAIAFHLESLFRIDHRYVPVKSALELIHVNVVAGCGGTGGGSLVPCIDMISEMLQSRGVRKIRINVTLIGPDIVTHDVTRRHSMDDRAADLIYETFATNYQYIHHLACLDRSSTSLQVIDRSNLRHFYSQSTNIERMLADALFFKWYTAAGMEANARFCDNDQIDQQAGRRF